MFIRSIIDVPQAVKLQVILRAIASNDQFNHSINFLPIAGNPAVGVTKHLLEPGKKFSLT